VVSRERQRHLERLEGCLKSGLRAADDAAEIEFFRIVAERDPPKKRVRELWIAAGRRGGKDSIASVIAARAAALFSEGDKLRPGERAVVMCLATDKTRRRSS